MKVSNFNREICFQPRKYLSPFTYSTRLSSNATRRINGIRYSVPARCVKNCNYSETTFSIEQPTNFGPRLVHIRTIAPWINITSTSCIKPFREGGMHFKNNCSLLHNDFIHILRDPYWYAGEIEWFCKGVKMKSISTFVLNKTRTFVTLTQLYQYCVYKIISFTSLGFLRSVSHFLKICAAEFQILKD